MTHSVSDGYWIKPGQDEHGCVCASKIVKSHIIETQLFQEWKKVSLGEVAIVNWLTRWADEDAVICVLRCRTTFS